MGYPLQYSCLENSVDRGAWWATVPRSQKLDRTEATNIQHTQSMNNVAKPLRFDLTFDALILVENTDKEVLLQDLGCCIQSRVCVGGGVVLFWFFVCFCKEIFKFSSTICCSIPCSMWDLSSTNRDRTHAPCLGSINT